MKAERERGDLCRENSRRREGCPVSFFLFFCGAIWRFFFCEPFLHKCKTLNSAVHKKGVRDVFEREDSP